MYVIRNHQRYRQTDGRTDVKRSHDRCIAKACSGKNTYCEYCVTKVILLQQSDQRLERSAATCCIDATTVSMFKNRLDKTWKVMGSYS